MRPWCLTCLWVALVSVLAPIGAKADQKSDDVAKIMALTDEDVLTQETRVTAAVDPVVQQFMNAHPGLPADAVVNLFASIHRYEEGFFAAIAGRVAARYSADMSDQQIRSVLAFYSTPAGQAYLHETASIRADIANRTANFIPFFLTLINLELRLALRWHSPPQQANSANGG